MADLHPDLTIPTPLPTTLPVMALRRGVLLPGTAVPFLVGRPKSVSALKAAHDGWLIIAGQRERASDPGPSDLLHTATLARVTSQTPTTEGPIHIVVQGVRRVQLTGFPSTTAHFEATFEVIDEVWPETPEAQGMRDALRDEVRESADVLGGEEVVQVLLTQEPPILIDAIATALGVSPQWQREILFTHGPEPRAEKVMTALVKAREAKAARQSIKERIANATRDQQREYILRQQLKAIQEELGDKSGDSEDELAALKERIEALDLADEVQEVVDRELRRLERLNPQSPERSVATDWLEWIADLPWNKASAMDVNLGVLEEALDRSHYGLDDVKSQVLEYLAVRKLAGSGRADVLLLLGPPGVGKTSIGQAIADATGRKLVRVALGGVRDEAELRGHRRTYIGARPGRLIEGIRRAGTNDAVILLDEIDKLGRGVQGDPAAALLEILDPEQNHSFTDRYLEVPFDLSKPLFIATANDLSSIPGPLRDRLQIIEIAGYSPEEKLTIAKRHLLPTIAQNAGVEVDDVQFTDAALREAIDGWTREAGVRELQRVLGKVYRKAAVQKARKQLESSLEVDVDDLSTYLGKRRFHEDDTEVVSRPGIALGLAWTPVGGSTLYVEASTLPGRGSLVLTGQLGDVMKESARAALTYVLAHHETLGIDAKIMETHDLHIHVPAGATPKDGPSAGVTMFTAIASLLSGRPVRHDVAMTGEATLRGRVLPVGGIKSKVLAAHRAGAKRVILPKRNAPDLDDVPAEVRDQLDIVLVDHMEQVLEAALVAGGRRQGDSKAA